MSPAVIRVGLVGFGYWGPNLARNFHDNEHTALAAICDRSGVRLAAARRRYPTAVATRDFMEICARDDIDLVAIATPMNSHFQVAKVAMELGKDVLIEKPLCGTWAEAQVLAELSRSLRRRVFVDHTFVYNPAVRKAVELVRRSDFGKPLYYDSVRANLGLFQPDVNVVWDLAPHDLSILDYLLGGVLPYSVACVGSAHIDGVESIAYVSLTYESGFIAHCHLSWLAPVKIRQILIGGSEKMLVYDEMNPAERVRLYDRGIVHSNGFSDPASQRVQYRIGDVYGPFVANAEALAIETDHIVDCYKSDAAPLTGVQAGANVVAILEAADRSMRNAGRPVALSEVLSSDSVR